MLLSKRGLLAALLCLSPVGTGAAQIVLTQAKIAEYWGAEARHVEWVQGLVGAFLIGAGCFVGGWLCQRIPARTAYVAVGLTMALIAAGMATWPPSLGAYVAWTAAYTFAVGLSYASFTAFVLHALGVGSGATKFNVLGSLACFPVWWVGLALGVAADRWGARSMLLTEAALGVLGIAVFLALERRVRRSKLPE
jgi:hypothetical protein